MIRVRYDTTSNFKGQTKELISQQKRIGFPFNEIVKQSLLTEKERLEEEVLNHEVTEEILLGPHAGSKYSGGILGRGNLFSFIGFRADSDPIGRFLRFLKSRIRYFKVSRISFVGNTGTLHSEIFIPTWEEIEAATPMDWSPKSWVRGIETGISGLGRYIFKRDWGRSTGGIQLKRGQYVPQIYQPRSYFTPIYDKFQERLTTI